MSKYKDKLNKLKGEERDIKKQKTFIPSQLSPAKKKYIAYEYKERLDEISDEKKELKEKQKKRLKSREEFSKQLRKLASTKVQSKSFLKKPDIRVSIKEYESPSILKDENRFFKGELNKEKRNMFFS